MRFPISLNSLRAVLVENKKRSTLGVTYLQDTTVIAIAHRLDSIREFDRIVVFKNGDIVGAGTFDELMGRNSYFEMLYRSSLESIEC